MEVVAGGHEMFNVKFGLIIGNGPPAVHGNAWVKCWGRWSPSAEVATLDPVSVHNQEGAK